MQNIVRLAHQQFRSYGRFGDILLCSLKFIRMFANSVDFTIMVLMLLDFMQINLIFFFFEFLFTKRGAFIFRLNPVLYLLAQC